MQPCLLVLCCQSLAYLWAAAGPILYFKSCLKNKDLLLILPYSRYCWPGTTNFSLAPAYGCGEVKGCLSSLIASVAANLRRLNIIRWIHMLLKLLNFSSEEL